MCQCSWDILTFPPLWLCFLPSMCKLRHLINHIWGSEIQNERKPVWPLQTVCFFSLLFFFHTGLFCSLLPNQAWGLLSTPVPVQTVAGKEVVPCSGITTFSPPVQGETCFPVCLMVRRSKTLKIWMPLYQREALIEIKRGMGCGLMALLRYAT